MKIQVGHSPDADDAFMFYALAHRRIDTGDFQFEHVLRDIETLNRWAFEKKLEVTALSVHAYAHVSHDYALLPHGASIGEGYGPIVVAAKGMRIEDLHEKTIAVPGELTTAFLALRLCLNKFHHKVIPFDQIFGAVRNREADAGLIIHEGQLTYPEYGLEKVLDLGEWWLNETNLPLPLGVNAVRKDLGREVCSQVSAYLFESIEYGLQHRSEAMEYAMEYARGAEASLADRFVAMYVNEYTRDIGAKGRQAVRQLLERAHAAGITPAPVLEIIES